MINMYGHDHDVLEGKFREDHIQRNERPIFRNRTLLRVLTDRDITDRGRKKKKISEVADGDAFQSLAPHTRWFKNRYVREMSWLVPVRWLVRGKKEEGKKLARGAQN